VKSTTEIRLRLLPYQVLADRWLVPALLWVPAGIALRLAAPRIPGAHPQLAPLALVISLVGALISAYALLASRAAVALGTQTFTVQTPLYPVVFSYARVDTVRPVTFGSAIATKGVRAAHRRVYGHLLARTAIVVTLRSYPLPIAWLRLWFHPLLLHPKERALILLVDDWMALSLGLESRRIQWREAIGKHS